MRITVFGAAGSVGRSVVEEALRRGHAVRAVVRDASRHGALPPAAETRTGDAGDAADVAELGAGQDLVVAATRPPAGAEHELVTTAKSLLAGAAAARVRLLLVGGAATLTVPGTGGLTVEEDPAFPPAWRPIARACAEQLAACRAQDTADWTYLSPPALLEPGGRTGRYRLGGDELVVDAEGVSRLSVADLAVVLLDEAERPAHRGARFTAAY